MIKWLKQHFYSFEDKPGKVHTWYGPLKDTKTLNGWQAEFFTPRIHRIFGISLWTTWENVESASILEAIYGRHERKK